MSKGPQDDDFMENIKYANNSKDSKLSDSEKELIKLQQEKEQFLQQQNHQFLEQLFKENSTTPIKIQNVQTTNSQSFRDSFLAKQLQPLLQSDNTVVSLEKFLGDIDGVLKNFAKSGTIENLLVSVHAINPQTSIFRRRNTKPDTINIVPVFNLVPIKRFFAKTGTNIGNGEGDGYIQFQLRNLFGGGENLEFDATSGTKTQSSYLINYNQPLFNNVNYMSENLFYVNERKLDWIQSKVKGRGMTNKIYTRFEKLNHEVILENYWKLLDNYGSKSLEVLSQSGSSYKSSIAYNLIYDSRNNKTLPTCGKFFQIGLEYNGLFKFNKYPYFKTAGQFQLNYNLPWINSTILTTSKFGILYPFTNTSSLLDRFYIGGPNDVRSFMMNGLGPKDYNASIGGDMFLNGGVSLISKIPRLDPESNFRIHNFINWGRLVKMQQYQGMTDNLKQLFHSHSVSYGIGILFNHPMARFELNVVVPLVAHETDSVRKGIQYGIGVSFL